MKTFKIYVLFFAVFFINCGLENIPIQATQYPDGWPQSAEEVAKLFDSLPVFMNPVKIDTPSSDGFVNVSLTNPNQYGHGTKLVFSSCTTTIWPHCEGLEAVYAETTSSIYGVRASTGYYFFQGDSGAYGGYIVLIHGNYNTNGMAGEKRIYFEDNLIDSLPYVDEVKIILKSPRPLLILKTWSYRSIQNNYRVYDRVLEKTVDYGFY